MDAEKLEHPTHHLLNRAVISSRWLHGKVGLYRTTSAVSISLQLFLGDFPMRSVDSTQAVLSFSRAPPTPSCHTQPSLCLDASCSSGRDRHLHMYVQLYCEHSLI
jgi:hypothetical protein